MNYFFAFYFATTVFILIRYFVLSRKKSKQAKYQLNIRMKPLDLFILSSFEVMFLVFWFVLLFAFPKKFVRAFFLSDLEALTHFNFFIGFSAGRVAAVLKMLFK